MDDGAHTATTKHTAPMAKRQIRGARADAGENIVGMREEGPMNHPPARILVVDDEAVIRRTLETLLRRQGYEVWTAADGAEAFKWLREGVFDLLLIDLGLPDVSGLEIAQSAGASQPGAAVLILTGSREFADAVGDTSASGFETMLKTASPQEVLDRVAALLALERGLHHARSADQR